MNSPKLINAGKIEIANIRGGFGTALSTDQDTRTFRGAIYNDKNCLVPESQRTILGDNEWNPDDPIELKDINFTHRILGKSLYLGHYTGHFGHFLLESLNRFWVFNLSDFSLNDYDNFVFHPFLHKIPNLRKFSPARVSFDCFGLDSKKVIILSEPSCFEYIDVPTPLFNINHSVDQRMAAVYRKIQDHSTRLKSSQIGFLDKITGWTESGELRIYVSRRKAKGYHPMLNEEEVENVFKRHGFKIFHPEKWSFEKQLAIFKRTRIMAGVEGSALHNSVFMQKGATVINIGTPRVPSGEILNQMLCNSLSGTVNQFISFKGEINSKNRASYDINHIESNLNSILIRQLS